MQLHICRSDEMKCKFSLFAFRWLERSLQRTNIYLLFRNYSPCFGYCAITQYACHGRSFTELNLTLFLKSAFRGGGKRNISCLFCVLLMCLCARNGKLGSWWTRKWTKSFVWRLDGKWSKFDSFFEDAKNLNVKFILIDSYPTSKNVFKLISTLH